MTETLIFFFFKMMTTGMDGLDSFGPWALPEAPEQNSAHGRLLSLCLPEPSSSLPEGRRRREPADYKCLLPRAAQGG